MTIEQYNDLLSPFMDKSQRAFATIIETKDHVYGGPMVYAPSWALAQEWIDKYIPYLKIQGEAEGIEAVDESFKIDYNNNSN